MPRSLTVVFYVIGVPVLGLALAACNKGERTPGEIVHLIAPPSGTLPPTYTLADETRPVLTSPPERRIDLPVPETDDAAYGFTLPEDVPGDLIATGTIQRAKHSYALVPQLLTRGRDPDGSPRATLQLPEVARGAGPPTTMTVLLTTIPASGTAETAVDDVAVPSEARLELAVGLSPAATIPGAAPVVVEVAVPLTTLAGRRTRFIFRARAVGDGRPVVLPLWADPTIVAPTTRRPERRNVVLISIDTLRADRLAKYGSYRRPMPQIDALARDAVVFTDTWSVWPETSGSHMSLFSSRFPSEHGVTSFIRAPSPTIELLAERLRREGYLTRAFTEDGGVWAHAGFARGFSAYSERRSADFVYRGEVEATFGDGTRWVEAHADRTFFLFLHTYQVHAPYQPPPTYRALYTDKPGLEPLPGRAAALAYDQEARWTDDKVGPFLAKLAQLGLRDRTIVVITSDHGEEFAEHGGIGHGRTLHGEVLRVPLVISAPGLLAPVEVMTPTSLLDVAPTLLDLLGLEPDVRHRGQSQVAVARTAAAGDKADPAVVTRPIFSELDRIERTHLQQLAVRCRHATAITDLATNTTQCYGPEDLAEEHPEPSCPELTELLELHRKAIVPVESVDPSQAADPELLEKMRALGYLQ